MEAACKEICAIRKAADIILWYHDISEDQCSPCVGIQCTDTYICKDLWRSVYSGNHAHGQMKCTVQPTDQLLTSKAMYEQ